MVKFKKALSILLIAALIGWGILFTGATLSRGHGNHMEGDSGFMIGTKDLGLGYKAWYFDTNDNGKVDHVKVILFIKNEKHSKGRFHIIFDDTYPKFLKEFGEEHSFE